MAEIIEAGVRVRFACDYLGPRETSDDAGAAALAAAVLELDALGCCPPLNDGLAAGNAAVRTAQGILLVTPSGRTPGRLAPREIIEIVDVDLDGWRVKYRAHAAKLRPTSDTMFHLAVLQTAWSDRAPAASLHGHVLEDAQDARHLGLPCSVEETLFSTLADYEATLELLRGAPYPAHRAWIRRGHGFIAAHEDLPRALAVVRDLLQRRGGSLKK